MPSPRKVSPSPSLSASTSFANERSAIVKPRMFGDSYSRAAGRCERRPDGLVCGFRARKPGGTMIHVVAIITAKPGQRAAVLEHFQANVPAVRAEAGCIEYGAAVDVENMGTASYGPDAFVVGEKWESEDHLKAHAAAPHMKAYGAKVKDMVASRVIHVLKPA